MGGQNGSGLLTDVNKTLGKIREFGIIKSWVQHLPCINLLTGVNINFKSE